MRILFIRPKQSEQTIGLQHIIIVEPLELEVLAALTATSDEVKIIDMILEKREVGEHIRSFRPDVVCVTGYITNIPAMISYCRTAKQINEAIVTITGGVHIENFPEDIDDFSVDYRVVRNATRAFPQLLDHLRGEAPLPSGILTKQEVKDPTKLPPFDFYFPKPRRDLVRHYMKHYFYIFHDRVSLLKTSFGCPYSCSFCYCIQITDHHYYARPVSEVLDELQEIEGDEVYIVDDNFLVSPARLREFMDGLRKRNIRKRYLVFGRADFIVKHPEVIQEFGELGLTSVIVGFESFSDTELIAMNKEIDANANEQAMQILNKYGVDCFASVILHPSWDRDDFTKLIKKARMLGIEYVVLQPLTPYPGTDFKVEESRMLFSRTDFDKWDLAHVAIKPEKLTLEQYYREILRAYNQIALSPRTILRHLKFPLRMQIKILSGLIRISQQYKKRAIEAKRDA
jgi:radical SAM superfamily enzyme YgiQ (UPF0313 family)